MYVVSASHRSNTDEKSAHVQLGWALQYSVQCCLQHDIRPPLPMGHVSERDWHETLLNVQGVLNNDKFKVTFMLDYRAMLTVHNEKYGGASSLYLGLLCAAWGYHGHACGTLRYIGCRRLHHPTLFVSVSILSAQMCCWQPLRDRRGVVLCTGYFVQLASRITSVRSSPYMSPSRGFCVSSVSAPLSERVGPTLWGFERS